MSSKTARVQANEIEAVYHDFADCLQRKKLFLGVGDGADKATIDNLRVPYLWCFGHSTAVDGQKALVKGGLYSKEKKSPRPLINKACVGVRRVKRRYVLRQEYDRLRELPEMLVDGKPVNQLQSFSKTRLLGAVAMCNGIVRAQSILAEMQKTAATRRRISLEQVGGTRTQGI